MEVLNLSPKTSLLIKEAFQAIEKEVIESGAGITCKLEVDTDGWADHICDAAWDLLNLHAEKTSELTDESRADILGSEPEDARVNYRFQLGPDGVSIERVAFIGTSIY